MSFPTYDELKAEYGYRTDADQEAVEHGTATPEQQALRQPLSVRAETFAEGWTFALLARSRGWVVSNPMSNGYKDVCHVTVWAMGLDDREALGQYRPTDWRRA